LFPDDYFCNNKNKITINPCFEGIVAAAICFPGEDAPLQVVAFYFLAHNIGISFFAGEHYFVDCSG